MTPPQEWHHYLIEQVGIELYEIPVTIASAAAVYLILLVAIRTFGVRILTATTATDVVVVIMLGAVGGRAILGPSPTLAYGIIALLTLITMESIFRGVQHAGRSGHLLGTKPVLVFVDGKHIPESCKATHTSVDDLNSAIRKAGAPTPNDVKCIVLEPNGTYSVIRAGSEFNVDMFSDVVGAERLSGQS